MTFQQTSSRLREAISSQQVPVHPELRTRELSQAERLKLLPDALRDEILKQYSEVQQEALLWDWNFWGRPKQFAPEGEWKTWIILAGRGFGKTRTGTQWVHKRALNGSSHTAIVVDTPADFRDHIWDGPGGFINIHPNERPRFKPSARRLEWPNGAIGTIYSAEDPEQLRGFSGQTAWMDEAAKYKNLTDVWTNLSFGMRELGKTRRDKPRRLITTTAKPLEILVEIRDEPETISVYGTSYENAANLDPSYYKENIAKYEGTRLGRQEIYSEILLDVPNALFQWEWFDRNRLSPQKLAQMIDQGFRLVRLVVAVDPSGAGQEIDLSSKAPSDIGIVAAGLGSDNRAYVLADDSLHAGPEGWGRQVVRTYKEWAADRVVAEKNFGGAMVEYVIKSIDSTIPVDLVSASRGKVQRADPVAVLCEKNEVRHVGHFPVLEDQLLKFSQSGYLGKRSPDRADAYIWAITKLKLGYSTEVTVQPVLGMY